MYDLFFKRIQYIGLILLFFCNFTNIAMSDIFDKEFIDNGDGTVTYKINGLIWKRCSEGQSWAKSYN